MLKWCSYCQHFIGEKEPYERLEFTHGICDSCRQLGRQSDKTHLKNLKPIVDFYKSLKDRAVSSERLNLSEIIEESRQLGLSSLDTAIGILQPALIEMGTLFMQSKVTAAKEHAFTAFVDKMVTHLLASHTAMETMDVEKPEVLLACVDGNYHWLGLKLLELALLEEKIPTRLYIPSLPTAEIISLALELRPAVIGLSIFDAKQAEEARVICDAIEGDQGARYRPKIAVGGNGARVYLEEHQQEALHIGSISYFRQAFAFTDFLKEQLKKQAG